jgi:hypothetical protein
MRNVAKNFFVIKSDVGETIGKDKGETINF